MAIINKRKTLLWNCPAQERTVVRWYLLLASYVAVCSSGAREHILGALLYCIGHGDTQVQFLVMLMSPHFTSQWRQWLV